jgi:Tfp pilus assembly protein FimT
MSRRLRQAGVNLIELLISIVTIADSGYVTVP